MSQRFQIIIPMSGQGQRFQKAGYKDPKPLIEVDGKPIIEHVVSMFPGDNDFIFICNKRHIKETPMQATLERIAPHGQIIVIDEHKLGPVYAVAQAFEEIDDSLPTVVSYCDYYAAWDFSEFKEHVLKTGVGGSIPCYRGFHPHLLLENLYAACLTDSQQNLIEIREKFSFTENKMESWQSSGAYYFQSGKLVKHYFEQLMARGLTCKDEYYVSLVFNLLVEDGLKVSVFEQPFFCQWGTPLDLKIYQRWSAIFRAIGDGKVPKLDLRSTEQPSTTLIPMAGAGSRFKEEGYEIPKPLIPVGPSPMIVQAVRSLPSSQKNVFVARTQHIEDFHVHEELARFFEDVDVVPVEYLTEGQASTCLLAKDRIDPDSVLTIGACDNGLIYDADKLEALLSSNDWDAIIWSFKDQPEVTTNPGMYGWVDVEDNGRTVKGVSCKIPLSDSPENDHAVVGTFTFRKAGEFFQMTESMIEQDCRVKGEFYVDTVPNEYLKAGKKVVVFQVEGYIGWGTPNDYKTFAYWQSFFDQWDSHGYSRTLDATYGEGR